MYERNLEEEVAILFSGTMSSVRFQCNTKTTFWYLHGFNTRAYSQEAPVLDLACFAKRSGRNLREKPLSYRKKEGAARPGKRSTLWLRGMDSPIDESDLGSLSHRRTSLEVEREGNRKGSPSLCLLLAAFLVHPALRRLQIQLQADGEYAAEQPQGLPAVIAELTRWAAQNLELTLKSEINVGPRLSEEGRLKRRSRKCNTTRGEPKACAKEEANQSEWRQGGEKRKIEQCKGERSCPLFSGNPPPHMSKKRERGRKNNHFTLAHEVAGLASAYSLSINKMRNGGERKRSLLKRLCTRNRTNADPEEWVWAFEKMNMQRVRADGDSRTGKSGTRHLLNKTKNKAIPCPREKLVMIAMNAALEDVYKKVFADSYQHGTDSEKEEAWHEIGGGRISDSELLDSMDGGRALQLKHEINVESTIIQRGTTKRDRDQPLVYRVPNLRFFKYPIPDIKSGKFLVGFSSSLSNRFESCLSHLFVVDFREEKRGIRQRRKANRAKLLWPFREVQLYRMLVREVGELLRSIDSPSISNPNENRSE
ncbi:hypothetical protein Tco_1440454 [Tanacetum coccineum]